MSGSLLQGGITVEIIEVRDGEVHREKLSVAPKATVADALAQCSYRRAHELLVASDRVDHVADSYVGIWGRRVLLSTPLTNDDRIELYTDLIADPKQTRLNRANAQGYRWQGRTRRAATSK